MGLKTSSIKKNFAHLRIQKFIFATAALSAVTLGTGCGSGVSPSSGIVNDISIKTYTVGSDQWMQMSTILNTNGFQMASVNVPITNPNDHSITYGNVSVNASLCSTKPCKYTADLTVALNVTQASLSHTLDPYLPNGTAVPIGGIDPALIVSLPIATTSVSNSRIYFAFDRVSGVGMLGAALTFAAFDPLGNYVPGLNYFQPFQINNVSLSAGIFAGAATNTTGIGLFVDISNLLKPQPTLLSRAMASLSPGKAVASAKLLFKTLTPSNSKLIKMGKRMNQMNGQGLVLKLN